MKKLKKIKFQKIVAIALAVVMSFITVSCSSESSNVQTEPQNDADTSANIDGEDPVYARFNGELEEGVTLQILENDTAIQQGYLDELLAAFNEEYAEYGITAVDANMDQFLDLANDGPYGYGPDVIYQANDVLMRNVDGRHIMLLPVERLSSYDSISKEVWSAYRADVEGAEYIFGVPVNLQSSLLFYRKDLIPEDWQDTWDDNSNDIPDMLETWNDLYKFSAERRNPVNGKYGYMKALNDLYFSAGFLFSHGGYVFGDEGRNPENIGFNKNDAVLGAWELLQLVSIMNEEAIDDTITSTAYSRLASGEYFATMTTPDVHQLFVQELALVYESEGLSSEEAYSKAEENIGVRIPPSVPASGDLSEENPELLPYRSMGGINGYAVSSYTKAPNAALAFVDFATQYDAVNRRHELLGITPVNSELANELGGLHLELFEQLDSGNIVIMPSTSETAQIWTPGATFFSDLAKDPYRPENERKYTSLEEIQAGLDQMSKDIHDAIFTLR